MSTTLVETALDLSEMAGWDGTEPPSTPRTTRYVVASVTGFPIGLSGRGSSRGPTSDYTILDTAVCHRIVASFSTAGGGRPTLVAKKLAEEACALLNETGEIPWFDGARNWRRGPRPAWHKRDYPDWPFL